MKTSHKNGQIIKDNYGDSSYIPFKRPSINSYQLRHISDGSFYKKSIFNGGFTKLCGTYSRIEG